MMTKQNHEPNHWKCCILITTKLINYTKQSLIKNKPNIKKFSKDNPLPCKPCPLPTQVIFILLMLLVDDSYLGL